MKSTRKIDAILILGLLISFALACSSTSTSTSQQAEANQIVDRANKKLDETKDLYSKAEARNTTLFSPNIQTVPQLRAYQARMNGEAKSIVSDFERVVDGLKDIAKQYDDISRLNVDQNYKEYAKIKSDEYAKRAEAVGIRKGNAQAFSEISDPRIMIAKFGENNNKSDKLFKDAEEIASKAKKIEDEHKDIFKQS